MRRAAEDPVVAALQEALAGEHAAVYAYAVIGGRLKDDSAVVKLAIDSYAGHRAHRDALTEVLLARRETPVPTEPGYELPSPIEGPASARALARRVEDRCGVLHAVVVGSASGDERRLGADALVSCAERGMQWGAPATAFPGVARA